MVQQFRIVACRDGAHGRTRVLEVRRELEAAWLRLRDGLQRNRLWQAGDPEPRLEVHVTCERDGVADAVRGVPGVVVR